MSLVRPPFILAHAQARRRCADFALEAPEGTVVKFMEPTRNLEQNARMWAMLTDIAKQVDWYGRKLDSHDWKAVFSSSLQKLDVVPNLDNTGFVALGTSTSNMSVREMRDMIELMFAFGAEKGVVWTDPKEKN